MRPKVRRLGVKNYKTVMYIMQGTHRKSRERDPRGSTNHYRKHNRTIRAFARTYHIRVACKRPYHTTPGKQKIPPLTPAGPPPPGPRAVGHIGHTWAPPRRPPAIARGLSPVARADREESGELVGRPQPDPASSGESPSRGPAANGNPHGAHVPRRNGSCITFLTSTGRVPWPPPNMQQTRKIKNRNVEPSRVRSML
jgi:hypothetical protein